MRERGGGEYGRVDEEAGQHESCGAYTTPCPESLNRKGEKRIAQHFAGPGLATADACLLHALEDPTCACCQQRGRVI